MMIRVVYKNDKYDMIRDILLDYLIGQGKIKKFFRSAGWAVIGVDKVRGMGGPYNGPDRRSLQE
jgi:hypothetical protein